MDENLEQQTRSVQHDQQAQPHPETREETIARVVDSVEAVGAERGGSADPSSRRGLNRSLGRALGGFALVGAVAGAALGLALSFAPGPFETNSALGALGYIVALAAAGALVAAVIGALVTLEREDGRVEREVEESTGRGPEGAGRPSAPAHDLDEH